METNKRQHFISLFILSLLLSCSGEKKDSAQTETVSNKAIVRIETVSAQDVGRCYSKYWLLLLL